MYKKYQIHHVQFVHAQQQDAKVCEHLVPGVQTAGTKSRSPDSTAYASGLLLWQSDIIFYIIKTQ